MSSGAGGGGPPRPTPRRVPSADELQLSELVPELPGPPPVPRDVDEPGDTEPSHDAPPSPPAELDAATRARIADRIARAIADELGAVRISSVPPTPDDKPPSEAPPRSSIRVAAKGTATATRIGLAVLGGAAIVAEFVAERWPHAVGPLRALGRVALRLWFGGDGQ